MDAFLELVHPEIEFDTRTPAVEYRGHAGIRRYFEEWVLEPWETLRLEILRIERTAENVAVVELRLTGRSRGTGIDLSMHYWDVLVGRDGLLVKRTVHLDEGDAVEDARAASELAR